MALARALRAKHDASAALYQEHLESVLHIQEELRTGIACERAPVDEHALRLAKEWIDDDRSVFRTLKKHNFRVADSHAALRQTLHWRMSVLAPLKAARTATLGSSSIRCLPSAVTDLSGRPVLLVRLANLPDNFEEMRLGILLALEEMRCRLHRSRGGAAFQCLIIVDFKEANLRSAGVELIPWYIREAAPNFPGMCAAVLMVNYSWTYSGLYNLVKRLLPSTVLERITFPTEAELLTHFERGRLPREYGGELDVPAPPEDTTLSRATMPLPDDPPRHSSPPPPNLDLAAHLPAMSLLNPFYGYPVMAGSQGSSIPQLRNGRRRKRDLARTLALLWLAKLKRTADKTWLWIILTLILWFAGLRRK